MTVLPWKKAATERGDQAEFERLVLPLFPALYNVARWLAREPADAEDLVQETYMKAWRGFAGFEPGTNFKAWIFRILRNTHLTSRTGLAALRTVALEDEIEIADGDLPEGAIERETPETRLLQMDDRAALQAAMERLSPPLLEVILLCDVEEMRYREIAIILDVPIGTVMSRISRARASLRCELRAESQAGAEVRA